MKRKVSIEEIKRFFGIANKQFEESGICLDNVRFIRKAEGLVEIEIDYRRKKTEHE